MSDDVRIVTGAQSGGAEGHDDLGPRSRRMIEDAFNRGDFTAVDELVAADAIQHDPSLPRELQGVPGPQPFKRTVSIYREAFPDVRLVVDDTIAEGDKVVLRWRAEGTHRGPLLGLAPTGVRGSVTGISINRWSDGKVVESWVEWDNLGLARLIGAAPPEGSLGERIVVASPIYKQHFDLESGECLEAPHHSVASYPARLEGGKVWIAP